MDLLNDNFECLVRQASQCTLCKESLPYSPNPVFSLSPAARVVLIGQAPGLIAHENTMPFSDKSGDRLRNWLQVSESTFYDKTQFAIMPMGFCFPGYKNGADAPPRKECAPKWHGPILKAIKPKLILLIGRYAQHYYLPQYRSLTQAIKHHDDTSQYAVLPHPSGRNNRWLAQNPWFESNYLPSIVSQLKQLL